MRTGHYLGYLKDELEEIGSGSYIEKFVTGGAKNYAFCVFYPSTGKSKQNQGEGYNLELRKFECCKLHHFEGYDFEGRRLNHEKIKLKDGCVCVVVSEPETKMLSLRSASL